MVSAKSMGTSTGIKEQYEKHKKFVGRGFLFPPPFIYILLKFDKNRKSYKEIISL